MNLDRNRASLSENRVCSEALQTPRRNTCERQSYRTQFFENSNETDLNI